MADESTIRTYEDQLSRIVLGTRRTTPDWLSLFEETSTGKTFENRIREVFDETGFVPAKNQYEAVQKQILEGKHLYEAEEALAAGEEPDSEDAKSSSRKTSKK